MRLAVFGATGRTGVRVVAKALKDGHEVVAVVRNPAKLRDSHPDLAGNDRLTMAEADAADEVAVAHAVEGTDAVIFAAGPVKGTPADFLVRAAGAIVAGAKKAGISRLVWLTGAGVMDPRDEPSGSRKVIRGIMKLMAGKILASSEEAYRIIVDSGLDYTVVRPPMLAEEAKGSGLVAGYTPPKPIPVGREDLAAFLVEAAVQDKYRGESPMLSYTARLK